MNTKLREKAYSEFKKVAQEEKPDGIETLAIFRLVPQFSTSTSEDWKSYKILFKAWSRAGDTDALLQHGAELYHGGYIPDELWEEGGELFEVGYRNWLATKDDLRYEHTRSYTPIDIYPYKVVID